jgi:anthranilate synthase
MKIHNYRTRGGIAIQRTTSQVAPDAVEGLIDELRDHRGVLLCSSYEVPGRYTRWDVGFVNPPLAITARSMGFEIAALNPRGAVLLDAILRRLESEPFIALEKRSAETLTGHIATSNVPFPEEQRSRQPTIFSLLRAVIDTFHSPTDSFLGLYGAFGYDLAFQFEPIRLKLPRPDDQRDLVLYLPDDLLVVDHARKETVRAQYDFQVNDKTTVGMPRGGESQPFIPNLEVTSRSDHQPGEYQKGVKLAIEAFARGDLFEVVLSQTFTEPCVDSPSKLFRRLRTRNPAPFGLFLNLGSNEYLVGASPEMYVRVEGERVETCPIAGTIARGTDPLSDAAQILQLLNSAKDTAELTMCTDVDRNDKSRICRPGSVRVIARKQIEMYSRLIHTVDHVEGYLREGFDALDAFLAHTWAVTATGAPKAHSLQFIEDNEKSPRCWYGAAVGILGFDGNINTGLTFRTARIRDGVAEVRAGASLVFDSDPSAEERESRVKASALFDALRDRSSDQARLRGAERASNVQIVLVDHQDSFVHTLGNYFRQTGAKVTTLRAGFDPQVLDALAPGLLVLSPGPGRPVDFNMSRLLDEALRRNVAIFGVCLGLQGLVEYFGGSLGVLPYPMHGKSSRVEVLGGRIFRGLPTSFQAGRYHSLFADRATFPGEALTVTAESEGVVMAIEHKSLPISAVQFHPESILSLENDVGLRLIQNVVDLVTVPAAAHR